MGVISETNYTIDLPERKNKNTIYHVNLMKPYFKRPEYLNLVIEEKNEQIEEDESIPYPVADANQFDFRELVNNSRLNERLSSDQVDTLYEKLNQNSEVFLLIQDLCIS